MRRLRSAHRNGPWLREPSRTLTGFLLVLLLLVLWVVSRPETALHHLAGLAFIIGIWILLFRNQRLLRRVRTAARMRR